MQYATMGLVVIAFVLHCFAFDHLGGLGGVTFALPFVFTPMAICGWLAFTWSAPRSQLVIFVTALVYLLWATWIYLDAAVYHWVVPSDAQTPIVFLFVGIYSTPVLIPLLLFAKWLEHRRPAT